MAEQAPHGLRRLFTNASWLLAGNIVGAGFALLSMVVAVRSLTTQEFGQLAIVTAFGAVAARLANTGSWQLVVTFGTAALHSSQASSLRLETVLRRTVILDAMAAIGAALVVFSATPLVARWFGWSADGESMLRLQSVVVLAGATGSAIGVLRLLNRFDLASLHNPVTTACRLCMVLLAWWAHAGLWGFVLAWALSFVAGNLALAVIALRTYLTSPPEDTSSTPASSGTASSALCADWDSTWPAEFWRAARLAYFAGLLRMGREFDVLIVGSLVPLSETGFYRLARTISATMAPLIDAFAQAILPDLSRLWHQDRQEHLLRLVAHSSLFVGGTVAVLVAGFAVAGDTVLVLVAGSAYVSAHATVMWCLAATATAAFTQPLAPAVLATGGFHRLIVIDGVTTPFYWLALLLMTLGWGIEGAAATYLLLHLTWGVAALGMLGVAVAARPSRRNRVVR
ncbi:MAG TPA: oligosaccharide flippase family protein [Hyphomicrobiaceae bacterium]|nr:oligosaccharide flippase family protein [Hyphomicrobiaceae bacterium]